MLNKYNPIGIIDSGIGGLSIINNILKILPNENIIYFGDNLFFPYGEKNINLIYNRVIKIIKFLISKKCKIIILACNTISSILYNYIKNKKNNIKIFDIISPVINILSDNIKKRIVIIGSKITIESNLYKNKILNKCKNSKIFQLPTPKLIYYIEKIYKINIDKIISITKYYFNKIINNNINILIPACTHYQIIMNVINNIIKKKNIYILDTNKICTIKIYKYLLINNIISNLKNGTINIFFSKNNNSSLIKFINNFLNTKNKIIIKKITL